jgi:hypothetical protein
VNRAFRTDDGCEFYLREYVDVQRVDERGGVTATLERVKPGAWVYGMIELMNDHTHSMCKQRLDCLPVFYVLEILQKRADGVKLIALNGAYNWCLDHDLVPSAVVVVDARPFNARFTKPAVDGCKYLIASQCDPSVLDGLPKERTYLWHTTADTVRDLLDEQYEIWYGVPGGSTVLLRAIPLLRMLGFKQFHLYGCDSCLGDEHHAYAQSENDTEVVIPVTVSDGRVFQCHPWMVAQAQEFMDLIKFLGDELEIATYGDGLLNHILVTGSKLAEE